MKVVVIGGGPAGMMAAITSAKQGNDVILLEKMKSCGRKLLITGKGRCNITSSLPMDKFIENIPENGKFLYSVFKNFTNQDIITLLKENNVNVKEERGNRIFPLSDRSLDVLQAFENEMKKNNVKIYTETEVKEIKTKDNAVNKVIYLNKRSGIVEEILTEKVILATGGKSYPLTGSTGDGYNIAKELGHTITKISGSLVPLISKNEDLQLCQAMQGLSLRNISMKIVDEEKNKKIYEDFGDRINSRTSEILSHITQGKYDRVGINEKMEVSVYAGTHVCSPKQLSTGTLEQIYFALRISLGEILTDEEPMPFLLDETFARYDETRIRNTLQWIGTQGRQMILFTCHKREMEYLDEMGIAYHKIELEGQ